MAVLQARPLRVHAASDAALLLWVAAAGDDCMRKERLLLKHKVRGSPEGWVLGLGKPNPR